MTLPTSVSEGSLLITVILVAIIAAIGLAGNGLTIHVYRTRDELKARKFYPLVLAMVDIFALCTMLPLNTLVVNTNPHIYRAIRLTSGTVLIAYIWIILAMTIERFLAVFKPFNYGMTRRKLRKVILALTTVHICTNGTITTSGFENDIPECAGICDIETIITHYNNKAIRVPMYFLQRRFIYHQQTRTEQARNTITTEKSSSHHSHQDVPSNMGYIRIVYGFGGCHSTRATNQSISDILVLH